MAQVKTLMKEQNGITLEARIMKTEHAPYVIEYYVNGKYNSKQEFPGCSIYFVEDAAENWLNGVRTLNG